MRKNRIIVMAGLLIAAVNLLDGCVASNVVNEKIGVQLWAENCNRCHNSPSPTDFTDAQWEKIGTHMSLRAALTEDETVRIIQFMQSAN